jgi:antirestriction protein ArdC
MTVYEIVTARIIEKLEQGVIPWRRPWRGPGRPANAISRRPYSGVNFFLLASSRFASPFWLTWNQAKELGGSIREGERSEIVVFWKVYYRDNRDGDEIEEHDPEMADDAASLYNLGAKRRFVLCFYRVWNVEQVELPENVRTRFQVETRAIDPIAQAERIIAEMPNSPAIEYHGSLAFYRPSTDTVVLPPRDTFVSPQGFYQSIYHELLHSTGHPKRLARPGISESIHFGSERYSREELVSELGAAFLCAAAGIDNATLEDHAAYLRGWLDALKADQRAIVQAAAQAQRGADYILHRTSTE